MISSNATSAIDLHANEVLILSTSPVGRHCEILLSKKS